ncbi:MAG: hypothetical protein EWV58_07875 [Microcystis aeruginosa Ma_MB_F_20061100_S19]|uniref:Addiction module component n=1 Tax=Microcystis aeruginosa SPC777 TaxID=482300 RepID=S3JZB2_MICAE|nr:hypothetical protein [Microcystis aeruginosa]NCR96521.1 hypothetical protein [Microcystis aeruginosa L311-01]OCY12245.1 MAG: hypothetical protein BEV12_02620 [Microcystis aeruginosa CACIAM 03]TRU11631.1 MAG: hypothetical protein EWV59_10265 [Microcystis aeruginosa Ma_MB_F_20061100_S19D]TRU16304.1 MAG: hypothetical protein EWV58_07875 [Microcystis aeruginosa Ma_MB_F_20061100_S19]EPF18369.1 hypothetical protein MAESPC_04515 [Microcystis aeruginosa SPC777]
MTTYYEILSQIENLPLTDKLRLLEDLKTIIKPTVVPKDDDEIIPAEELAESQAAWQDYLSGRDTGITSTELKYKLFGDKLG